MPIQYATPPSPDSGSVDDGPESGSGLLDLLDWLRSYDEDHPQPALTDLQSRTKEIKDAALDRVHSAAENMALLQHEQSQKFRDDLHHLRSDIARQVDSLNESWNEARNVRFRDKWSFVMGVMTVVTTTWLIPTKPEYLPHLYSVLALWYLPIRVYQYAVQRPWGYFLLDWCYFSNVIQLVYIWFAPQSLLLWTVCYCSAHGPLAFSVATWRNSLVFHSLDKMTSVFIHMMPPIVFHAIHFLIPADLRERDYPAAAQLESLGLDTSIGFCFVVYALWQAAYLYFISYRKGEKIRSGKRINSFSTMSKGKGAIGHLISSVPSAWREPFFIFLQFVYTFLTILPAPLIFYKSRSVAAGFLLAVFVCAVFNGGSYYVEVFGRKFEKQLNALQKQIREAQAVDNAHGELEVHATVSPQEKKKDAELRKR